jgi:hypothetical protein
VNKARSHGLALLNGLSVASNRHFLVKNEYLLDPGSRVLHHAGDSSLLLRRLLLLVGASAAIVIVERVLEPINFLLKRLLRLLFGFL